MNIDNNIDSDIDEFRILVYLWWGEKIYSYKPEILSSCDDIKKIQAFLIAGWALFSYLDIKM